MTFFELCRKLAHLGINFAAETLKHSIMVTKEYFDELTESMGKRSVESLVAEFNKQVGSRAWTSLRGLHDSVLIDTLIAKGVDVSAVYDGVTISFKRKIALNADKTKVVFA